ncbi:MAG: hydroxymethylpyrimidine/phosphomethylpyrimidine kinase [Bacteroidetes bacterium]|nr:hydroxymethylpyrimidine/phosphomethylpyrimidine kinase [Bacteroidota bacterium]
MQTERPYVLTIAGFDPSSGAGLTADIKTFEQCKVYGLALCTSLTLQTENEFISVTWRKLEEVKKELDVLLVKYPVKAVKFGIVPSMDWLHTLTSVIKDHDPDILIVVDPIWKSSTGFSLNDKGINLDKDFLKKITLITPNIPELEFMSKGKNENQLINEMASYSNVLVKGGHKALNTGTDVLYQKETTSEFTSLIKHAFPKHGSGCVLSAAITANLALGFNVKQSCKLAKKYIEQFLITNKSLLGFHAS